MSKLLYILLILSLILGFGCKKNADSEGTNSDSTATVEPAPAEFLKPEFDADSAFFYVQKQVAFGPRVPNTPAHKKCADYFVNFFKAQGATVTVQDAKVKDHNGNTLEIKNIIASYLPNAGRRVMLSAHWDSRPRADEDSARQTFPIDGANDGASGVGVLMEYARQFKKLPPEIGVDLVLWDAEDGGVSGDNNSWCLGSQYWAKNPHKPGYKAEYGINLDMVGAKNATFPKETYSLQSAAGVVNKVWTAGHQLGYGAYFAMTEHGPITDDHYFVSAIAGIPYIDVIHIRLGTGERGFFEHWHTHGDNLTVIDKTTLRAVGETVLSVVRSEKP